MRIIVVGREIRERGDNTEREGKREKVSSLSRKKGKPKKVSLFTQLDALLPCTHISVIPLLPEPFNPEEMAPAIE